MKKIVMSVVVVLVAILMISVAYYAGLKKGLKDGSKKASEDYERRLQNLQDLYLHGEADNNGTSTDGVVQAVFNDGTLTFTGEGAIVGSRRWLKLTDEQRRQVKKIVIGEGITYIDPREFERDNFDDYSFINLKEVVIDASLIGIGYGAFRGNKALEKITFNDSCTNFEVGSLLGLSSDKVIGITLPRSVYMTEEQLKPEPTRKPEPAPVLDAEHSTPAATEGSDHMEADFGFGF